VDKLRPLSDLAGTNSPSPSGIPLRKDRVRPSLRQRSVTLPHPSSVVSPNDSIFATPVTGNRGDETTPKEVLLGSAQEELDSQEHQRKHAAALKSKCSFPSRTSLTPRTALSLETPTTAKPIPRPEFEMHKTPLYDTARGYALSEMADLRRMYLESSNTSTSLQESITLLAGKTHLVQKDIVDRGVDAMDLSKPRFFINQELERCIASTATDMQGLLEQAADLIQDRDSHFIIDPEDVLLPSLRGCSTIS
jgi:hypothetical protein